MSEEDLVKKQDDRIEELSQELFGKPSKDIKYVLVTNYIHQQLLDEELARTGLYQWINVFKGEVKYPRDIVDYNDYDIVQVNFSGQDLHLIGNIREHIGKDSKTKLIVNNDYTTELWGSSFDFPTTIKRELNYADMLFGTEYFQTTALTEISGRICYIMPHPADIKRLKSITPMPKKNIITTIWRRYDQHAYIPSLVTRNHGLVTQLIGYDKAIDRKPWVTATLYDYVYLGTNYFDFCNQMRESKIVYDPFTYHSYSRSTVDTAALGIPVVGSNRTQSCNVCYPYTVVDPYDVTAARNLIKKLIEDKEFYDLVVKTALEKVEFYNHENSKHRYLECLKDALTNNNKVIENIPKTDKNVHGIGEDYNLAKAKELNRDAKA